MVLKVYGFPMSTCVARVLTCAYEKEVEVELVHVNLPTGEHKNPEYLATKNPLGKSRLWSMMTSLYSGTDLLRHGDTKEVALVNVWLEVESQSYNPAIAALVFEIVFKPSLGMNTSEEAVAAYTVKSEKVLDVYEDRLSKCKYLAGDFFSLADLNHLTYTFYLMTTPKAELINSRPHVKAWWEDISSRPAFKKVAAGMGVH